MENIINDMKRINKRMEHSIEILKERKRINMITKTDIINLEYNLLNRLKDHMYEDRTRSKVDKRYYRLSVGFDKFKEILNEEVNKLL